MANGNDNQIGIGQPEQALPNPPNPQQVALPNPPNPQNPPMEGASVRSVSSSISAATVSFGQHPNQVGSPIPPDSTPSHGDTTVPLSPSFWNRQQAELSAMNRLNFSSPESMLSEDSHC